MKRKLSFGLFGMLFAGSASAQGLYYVGSEAQESIPLKWVVGFGATYDDNVSPGYGPKQDSFGVNPYAGMSFVDITPQTTWDVYARLGLIYYFDAPDGMDDLNSQSRVGINWVHRISERLRLSSRNFVSYELEPDYSYGYASSRQSGEYFYWQSDNSVGFRWSERFATYSGAVFTGTSYTDTDNSDRFTWELYNQARYQLGPQSVLTFDTRYAETSGNGAFSDAADIYLLGGVEHRFSPNTIGIIRAGVQFHDVDGGDNSTSPYLELALNSQVNQQLRVRAFARYGIENYSNVQDDPTAGLVEYEDSRTLRLGGAADYVISPNLSIFGGVDYIPTSYQSGTSVTNPPFIGSISDLDEQIFNAYVGMSLKLNDYITGTATYNYTHSSSDIAGHDYNRNRISIGVSTEF